MSTKQTNLWANYVINSQLRNRKIRVMSIPMEYDDSEWILLILFIQCNDILLF